eukprot:855865-Prymnesium_polylepis.1
MGCCRGRAAPKHGARVTCRRVACGRERRAAKDAERAQVGRAAAAQVGRAQSVGDRLAVPRVGSRRGADRRRVVAVELRREPGSGERPRRQRVASANAKPLA